MISKGLNCSFCSVRPLHAMLDENGHEEAAMEFALHYKCVFGTSINPSVPESSVLNPIYKTGRDAETGTHGGEIDP